MGQNSYVNDSKRNYARYSPHPQNDEISCPPKALSNLQEVIASTIVEKSKEEDRGKVLKKISQNIVNFKQSQILR